MSKQVIKLTEEQLRQMINECVQQVLNEEVEEGIAKDAWNSVKNAGKAFGRSMTQGGGFNMHYNGLQNQYMKGERDALKSKYGVEDGRNDAYISKQMAQPKVDNYNATMQQQIQNLEAQKNQEIANVEQKYNQKIANVQAKYGKRIDKANASAQQRTAQYRQQKNNLDRNVKMYRNRFNQAKNYDPSAQYGE